MHQQSLLSKNKNKERINWLILFLSALCIVSIFNCPKQIPISQDLTAPNWQDGEQSYYNIIRKNKVIGTLRYTLLFDMNADIPVYILELVTNMAPEEEYYYDSSVVCFRRSDFVPIWAWRKVESDLGYSIMTTRYNTNKAEIWKETIDGNESMTVKYKQPTYDNEMVLTLLRAAQFKLKRKYTFNAIIPISARKISNTVRQMAKTNITTRAGTFECNKIQLRYRNKTYIICYERNEPKRLVRSQEKDSDIVLELANNNIQY